MNNETKGGFLTGFLAAVSLVGLLSISVLILMYHAGYTDGQIDAVNNKIYIKLVTKSDLTKDWVDIREPITVEEARKDVK